MTNFHTLLKSAYRLRVKRFKCPACNNSLLIRIGDSETDVRCIRCRGTTVHLSLLEAINQTIETPKSKIAYELSSKGPTVRFLKTRFMKVHTSECFDDLPLGSTADGIRCEDVQRLTYPNSSFDLCTSTEVFEHVPDDTAGFQEIRRVLKDNGYFIFTVPLNHSEVTLERARLNNQTINYILPAMYHNDKIRGYGQVLVYRDYGADITDRLIAAGFSKAWIRETRKEYFGFSRKVVVTIA